MLDKWFIVENYACNKYYSVSYELEGSYTPRNVKGVLISLACEKITLLCEGGMFVIPLKDVKYIQPSTPRIEAFCQNYQKVLKQLLEIKENNNGH
jgi:hypothetical protein